ncbi:hypothetical protein BV898_10042 [Hypsibius exemplaris]|uniref:G-protein coupled receptors family 1 profile domain-containing protein n=1 Tax=Hypsibius exemplaris TaxID=2072580 RepID=A0A1W0WKT8_HYPEX|nr:hypothetical protein BV898_10042 [Hypsibius exemplaris]
MEVLHYRFNDSFRHLLLTNYRANSSNNSSSTRAGGKIIIDVVASFTIFSIIATLILNALVIAVYIKRPTLRTPFSIYIVNLAVSEIVLAGTSMPGNLIREMHGAWPFNAISCTLLLYISQTLTSGIRYGHVLITANRLWAVTFPIGYKQRHTKRFARCLVVTMWMVVHALNLPVIINGRLQWSRSLFDPDSRCVFDNRAQFNSVLAVQLLAFTLPELFIIVAYGYVAVTLKKRWRPNLLSNKVAIGQSTVHCVSSQVDDAAASERRVQFRQSGPQTSTEKPGGNSWQSRSYNRLLAYLTIAVMVCWTPNHVYYLMMHLTGFSHQLFFAVQYFMLYANSWLNPVLIYMADTQIRVAVNGLFC